MKTTKLISGIIAGFCIAILIVLLMLLVKIPDIADFGKILLKYTGGNAVSFCIFLYLGDLAAIWFMVQLLMIMKSVVAGTPFIMRNVRALKHIAITCFVAFLDFAGLIFAYRNFSCVGLEICSVILLFGCLCAYVLSRVFAEAVRCKDENDLTV